jgi:hypothetical protein
MKVFKAATIVIDYHIMHSKKKGTIVSVRH